MAWQIPGCRVYLTLIKEQNQSQSRNEGNPGMKEEKISLDIHKVKPNILKKML